MYLTTLRLIPLEPFQEIVAWVSFPGKYVGTIVSGTEGGRNNINSKCSYNTSTFKSCEHISVMYDGAFQLYLARAHVHACLPTQSTTYIYPTTPKKHTPCLMISTISWLQWCPMSAASTVIHASHVKIPASLAASSYTNSLPLVETTSLGPLIHLIMGVVSKLLTTPTSQRRESLSPEKFSPKQSSSPDPALEKTVVVISGSGSPGEGGVSQRMAFNAGLHCNLLLMEMDITSDPLFPSTKIVAVAGSMSTVHV